SIQLFSTLNHLIQLQINQVNQMSLQQLNFYLMKCTTLIHAYVQFALFCYRYWHLLISNTDINLQDFVCLKVIYEIYIMLEARTIYYGSITSTILFEILLIRSYNVIILCVDDWTQCTYIGFDQQCQFLQGFFNLYTICTFQRYLEIVSMQKRKPIFCLHNSNTSCLCCFLNQSNHIFVPLMQCLLHTTFQSKYCKVIQLQMMTLVQYHRNVQELCNALTMLMTYQRLF
ncbi:unnamed protein product, partial (macronuclear) [Paramecium tetraurelia]